MAPTEQEERCVVLLCKHLSGNPGGEWRVDEWLDDTDNSEPTPDAVLTNGLEYLAVEIKQLTDGETFHTNNWKYISLRQQLAPESGGEFALFTPTVIGWSFDKKLISQLKRKLAKAAVHLSVGQSTEI